MNQRALATALETGTGISTIERGTVVGLSTRGSSAITNSNGEIIAAVTCGHDLSLPKYVDAIKESSNCDVTLFVDDTRMNTTFMDENGERMIGTKADPEIADSVLNKLTPVMSVITLFESKYSVCYSPLVAGDVIYGMVFTGVNIDESIHEKSVMLNWVIAAAIASGLASIVLVFLFINAAVSKPLKKIGAFANKIRLGELGLTASEENTIGIRSHDEVGTLARMLEEAYGQLRGYIAEIRDRMQGLADGDFVTECSYDFLGDFTLIKDSMNKIVQDLNQTMTEINSSATQVSAGSTHIADVAQELAHGAAEQASSIEKLSAALIGISNDTKDKAGNGTTIMDEMVKSVVDINEASNEIENIIKVIDDIAFQTNILALNASVEAARAGSYGKGFAVVAEEVKTLATRSQSAAHETKQLIANSLKLADEGVHLAGETQSALKSIVESIDGLSEVMNGIEQVSSIVQQNSVTAQESAASSEQMSSQSSIMHGLIGQFRLREAIGSGSQGLLRSC
jgi:methyl-accepting chemotaxis protein